MVPRAYYFACLAVSIVIAAGYAIFAGGRRRHLALQVTVALMTVFTASYLFVSISQHKIGKTNWAVAADQAEMQLRMVNIVHDGLAELGKKLGFAAATREEDRVLLGVALESMQWGLQKAVAEQPQDVDLKAKLVVVLALEDEISPPANHTSEISNLCRDMTADKTADSSDARLSQVLRAIFVEGRLTLPDTDAAALLRQRLGGWYANQAIDRLYKVARDRRLREEHDHAVEARNASIFGCIIAAGLVIITAGIIGVVAIAWQIISRLLAGGSVPDEHLDEGAVGLRRKEPGENGFVTCGLSPFTIYAVFICWFSMQIGVSLALHSWIAHLNQSPAQPLAVASSTALTYLCSNILGPAVIYFLALKPAGLDFWRALRLQTDGNAGSIFKLIGCGILGACATIPLVVAGVLLGHVQGSDNPVVGQIMQASTASSLPAVLIFYFTLGVMAPFFEEIMFRGFIFAALKTYLGTFPALLASAVLFAVMHFDRGGLLLLTIIGLVLGFVFNRTRSLIPSMICHGLWNSGSFTLALIVFSA